MASEYSRQIPAALPLEKAGPKGYIRFVFPLELLDNYDLDEVFRTLQAGFEYAKEKIPTLACEAVPDTDAKQAGVLKLQRITDNREAVTYKDLRAPGAFQHSYKELKAKKFPAAAFPDELICRRYTWPSPGERLVVADSQANFIPGGLLLQTCFLHVFGDATAFYCWLDAWAEGCRHARGQLPQAGKELPDDIFTDREKFMKPSGRNAGKVEDHPEFTVLPFTPPGLPPKITSREHHAQIVYFSAEAREKLKADASPANATRPTDVEWISSNDAVAALVWRSVMAAQFPLEKLEGDPPSVYNISLDGRLRTDPPVHPRTLGNWLGWVAPSMGIRTMLESSNLADIAAAIRKTMLRLNNQYVDDMNTLIENQEDLNRVLATAFLDIPGHNLVATSWISLELYDLDWGNAFASRIQAVRCSDLGVINGGCAVLPVLPDGGIEMLIGVESNNLDRLQKDPLLNKYAKLITL
ncbi:hypothetical protein F5B20DRAFT_94971 [Whalleya microplaca]|nr:hypothetical protein F5B20DRAFT_94971 [Whalleya microplaca]